MPVPEPAPVPAAPLRPPTIPPVPVIHPQPIPQSQPGPQTARIPVGQPGRMASVPTVPSQTVLGAMPVPPQSSSKKPNTVTLMFIGAGLAFTVIMAILYLFWFPNDRLIIDNQKPDNKIYVRQLKISKLGILVAKKIVANDGNQPVIAKTSFLNPEDYREFSVPLVDETTQMSPGDEYVAMVYSDTNDDGIFNPDVDKPMKDMFGRTVRRTFMIR